MSQLEIGFLQVSSGKGHPPTATVSLLRGDDVIGTASEIASGSCEAVWKAIAKITGTKLLRYGRPAIDVMGPAECPGYEVSVKLKDAVGNSHLGKCMDSDLITAYGNACVSAINASEIPLVKEKALV